MTCEQCEAFFGKIADLLKTSQFASMVATDLSGPVFCENPNYIMDEQLEDCQKWMGMLGEKAVSALGVLLQKDAARLCEEDNCTE